MEKYESKIFIFSSRLQRTFMLTKLTLLFFSFVVSMMFLLSLSLFRYMSNVHSSFSEHYVLTLTTNKTVDNILNGDEIEIANVRRQLDGVLGRGGSAIVK